MLLVLCIFFFFFFLAGREGFNGFVVGRLAGDGARFRVGILDVISFVGSVLVVALCIRDFGLQVEEGMGPEGALMSCMSLIRTTSLIYLRARKKCSIEVEKIAGLLKNKALPYS